MHIDRVRPVRVGGRHQWRHAIARRGPPTSSRLTNPSSSRRMIVCVKVGERQEGPIVDMSASFHCDDRGLAVVSTVLLSLGSNLGDRGGNLAAGVRGLGGLEGVRVVAVSHCYETAPWGLEDQPWFLNVGVEIETTLWPRELLAGLKRIEREAGRAPGPRWGPRTLDIDIILWDERIIEEAELRVPHPEFRSRAFVLVPLAEIAAERVDPVSGLTIEALARSAAGRGDVERAGRLELAHGDGQGGRGVNVSNFDSRGCDFY